MHEWMGDHRNYDTTIPYLDIENYTWVFVDFRGYGLSKEIKGEYNLNEACEDIVSLIKNLDLDEVHLVGHSMSSLIAQKLALILQEKVKTLILITPIPPTGIKMKENAKNKLLENVKKMKTVL